MQDGNFKTAFKFLAMPQLEMDFTTASQINVERLKGQNKRLYEYLLAGNTIHCFSPAMQKLRIGYLNSRSSDLINKHNVPVKKEWVKVPDVEGELTSVVEYSITKENIMRIKNLFQ